MGLGVRSTDVAGTPSFLIGYNLAMVSAPGQNSTSPAYTPGLLVVLAYAFGIALDRFLNCHWFGYLIVLVGAVGFSLFVVRSRFARPQRYPRWQRRQRLATLAAVAVMVGFGAVGALRHHVYWNWYPQDEIGFRATGPTPVAVKLTLLTEPRHIAAAPTENRRRDSDPEKQMRVLVRCNEIRDGDQWVKISGLAWLRMPTKKPGLNSGDQIKLFGTLVRVDGPSNPGQYDFSKHYRRQRILASLHCFNPDAITVLHPGGQHFISGLRSRLDRLAWRYLPPDQAALTSAILLGNRQQVDVARRDNFLKTGTVHLLAISGLHVGILAGLMYVLFKAGWLGRVNCLLLTILFVAFYAWLVEFRPPVVRASLFIVLFCIARLSGRTGQSFNILALAAMLVLVLNPTDLFALGAQLSFLAVAAIVFGKDWVLGGAVDPLDQVILATRRRWLKWMTTIRNSLRAAFVVSALVWVMSIPLVARQFHVLSPIGLIVNPLLLLPISLALYSGLAMFVFGDVLPLLTRIVVVVVAGSLTMLEGMVTIAGGFSGGHFWTPGPPWWSVAVFYIGWVVLGLCPTTRISNRCLCLVGVAWLLLGWGLPNAAVRWQNSRLAVPMEVTFIDVGHGTCVLVKLPEGKNILYDCGSTSPVRYTVNTISGVLWHKGIFDLDAVIISHADADHYSAVSGVADRFPIDKVVVSPLTASSRSPAVQKLLTEFGRRGITIETVTAGGRIHLGDAAAIDVLAPIETGDHTNDNSTSIVVAIKCHGRTVLLPGDLEHEGLERLLAQPPLDCDLMMAAHHGSPNSDPARFLDWARPEYVVVSCGDRKFSALSEKLYSRSGCVVKRTDRGGAVSFLVYPDGRIGYRSYLMPNFSKSSLIRQNLETAATLK